jgi:hypothetical protein
MYVVYVVRLKNVFASCKVWNVRERERERERERDVKDLNPWNGTIPIQIIIFPFSCKMTT